MTHRALIAALLLGAHGFTACTSWQVQSVTPQELIARDHPKAIQIRERGGAVYVVESPRVAGDSLTGFERASKRSAAYRAGAALGSLVKRSTPLMMVDRVAVRRFNDLKTVGLVLGVPVGLFLALGALIYIDCGSGGIWEGDC